MKNNQFTDGNNVRGSELDHFDSFLRYHLQSIRIWIISNKNVYIGNGSVPHV